MPLTDRKTSQPQPEEIRRSKNTATKSAVAKVVNVGDEQYVILPKGFWVSAEEVCCGTIIAAWWAGIAVGVIFCMLWSRARAGGGVARAFAVFYWHLPFDLFKRVPASARRHFFG